MANRTGTRWLINAEFDLPELNLLAAVIQKAIRDFQHGRANERADALTYLAGDNFRVDCAILGLRAERVLALLQQKDEDDEPDDAKLTDDQIAAIYARYTQENDLNLRALARQYDTTAATLSRRFARLQLAARGRGNPNITIVPRRRGRPRRAEQGSRQGEL